MITKEEFREKVIDAIYRWRKSGVSDKEIEAELIAITISWVAAQAIIATTDKLKNEK